ncbi:polysaccharide export protein [Flavobacterium sp. MFBS3-15]|uniref:polysaccharide biosynthesis/export family protein n=1 Tax=Flavobacterium sp. MFBS3-15 TaxID=2989816 RepID=UPI002236B2F9|nr:polysaccharide biosynthesis/export family protein [Flavobacterium sp. MFBS3-15]MCW4469588.1 polysaccharide export protein [Flavobacterium sp. MFBS3-15]
MINRIAILLISATCLVSCVSSKKIVYLNKGSGTEDSEAKYESKLQPDDNIFITVTSSQPELAAQFNLVYVSMMTTKSNIINNDALSSYLIDQNGEINFPVFGKIKLSGLTRIEAEEKITNLLKDELKDPSVSIRMVNFKVTISGEVARPGVVTIPGERLTIFEALGLAGDLTIYGKRDNVMVIREEDGVKKISYVDLTDSNLINSEFYYLRRNDFLYVEPNKTRVNSSAIGPNLTVGLSALSLLVTIIALSTR